MFKFISNKMRPIDFNQNMHTNYKARPVCHYSVYNCYQDFKNSITNFITTRTPVCYTAVL